VGGKFIFGRRKKMCVERYLPNLSLVKAKVGKKKERVRKIKNTF
jgi:hypothetical protein